MRVPWEVSLPNLVDLEKYLILLPVQNVVRSTKNGKRSPEELSKTSSPILLGKVSPMGLGVIGQVAYLNDSFLLTYLIFCEKQLVLV